MNFAGSIVDNFIMLRFLHPQELIFGRSTLQKRKADSRNWLFTYLYSHDSGTRRCFAKLLHTPCIATMQRQPFWKIYSERREKAPRRTGSSGSSQMVQRFSGHSGWNGKRGIRLKISIFFGNFPVEWAVPFKFPTGIFGCWQMVNARGNFTLFCRGRHRLVHKSVPHVQQDDFSTLDQSNS